MSTQDGFYYETDGLAMGSPPAPHFANGWLNKYDSKIQGESKIYLRYMDDILTELKVGDCEINLGSLMSSIPV